MIHFYWNEVFSMAVEKNWLLFKKSPWDLDVTTTPTQATLWKPDSSMKRVFWQQLVWVSLTKIFVMSFRIGEGGNLQDNFDYPVFFFSFFFLKENKIKMLTCYFWAGKDSNFPIDWEPAEISPWRRCFNDSELVHLIWGEWRLKALTYIHGPKSISCGLPKPFSLTLTV